MAKLITCEDGFIIRGGDDELVRNAEAHIRDAHPELVGMTREQILEMAREGD